MKKYNKKYEKNELKINEEIIYNNKKTKIIELEWDDFFGYDVLIEENNKYIWVADKVEKI